MNPFYLIIHSATGHFKEKNDKTYLIIDSTEKYEEVFSGIGSEIKTINCGKDLPLNKPLNFPTLTIIIRCVFQEDEKFYPKIYLNEFLYESRV